MLYRNFLAMETEELIRSQPVDGVVLMGGCDKTTPGLILGATSAGVPAIFMPAGPMLRGNWQGKALGSGSDAWKYWDERRAGNISDKRLERDAGGHRPLLRRLHDHGHRLDHDRPRRHRSACACPAPRRSRRRRQPHPHGAATGRRIVEMVWEDLTPTKIMTRRVLNAIVVAMAMGCSTNAVIHVLAMARRAGHDIGLDDFDAASRARCR
jgi:dihydroxyacid dehydratase/phosphogluconate dehydratase